MASNASCSVSIPQKRKAVTDGDRAILRKRYQEHPCKQSDLINWFRQETGHKLDQSQVSRILSKKYDYVDDLDKKKDKLALQAQRSSVGEWPELEAALFEWQQRMQKKRAVITGELLKQQAAKFWNALPQYQGKEQPRFSNGWLQGFQKRFNIREYVNHGEAASAEIENPDAIAQMQNLRRLVIEYDPDDILNMDETGLFWKLTPDRTLATQAGSGGKKSKDRITLVFTVSASGKKELVWCIGKSKNPRCFKNINQKLLRVIYRYNKTKWMTGLIMEEYLRWLDNKMRVEGRKVLLLLDNFSGHELGVTLVGGKEGLANVRIEWLPPNTTSHWQPLDQGIIASFKLQYRRLWISYMLRQYEANKNPHETVHLLKAIQWTRVAWDNVSSISIQKCWWKSTIIKRPDDQAEEGTASQDQQDRDELQAQIVQLPCITEPISVNEFIQLGSEVIEEDTHIVTEYEIFQQVVERYALAEEDTAEPAEDAVVGEEDPDIPVSEAIKALETLKLFEMRQEDGSEALIRALDQADRRYLAKKHEGRKQRTIESFFQKK
jgi:DDE superfamily endonuclease/Tc5 transposase DNA-binding domain/Fission yeast centromere protein N-terminal domain